MVGLFNDPKGETVTTFVTSGQIEEVQPTNKSGNGTENELKKLRLRVNELESVVKQQVSPYSVLLCTCDRWYISIQISGTLSFVCTYYNTSELK